ncbi:MAG: RIP metalloprotease RseP [Bryobacteraceae bacterium]
MAFLQPLFWFVILLGVMIVVHEMGHFWACISVGIKVETFSLGFGPRLFGFNRRGTDFRVSAILFGGYVRMLGEQAGDEKAADPRSFQAKARWQRAIVIIAGPLMNVVLAFVIVTALYMHGFEREVQSTGAVISSVDPNSPAAAAGLESGDRIVQLNGKSNPSWQDVLTEEALNANHPLPVTIDRKGQRLSLHVTPRMDPKEGVGVAGWRGDVQVGEVMPNSPAQAAGLRAGDVLISVNGKPVDSALTVHEAIVRSAGRPVEFETLRGNSIQRLSITPAANQDPKLPWRIGIGFRMPVEMVKLGFASAVEESARYNLQNATIIFQVLRSIVERRVSPKTLAGPIGMAQMSGQAAQQGPLEYLALMSIISLNLAIFNLLPIPILDGGTLLLLIIEMLIQREVSMQVKETVLKLGFVFLMMIVVFAIYNDISRILTRS